jgi:tetratricopeptide (TPR) repeat protein
MEMIAKTLIRSAALAAVALSLAAQTADTKQPKPKSQKEVDALNQLFSAQDPDGRIAAAENLITKFADTEFKGLALFMATDAAEQKGDIEKVLIYGERTVQADPKNFGAMIAMCRNLANSTKEFDLDKEEKLNKAEKHCKDALPLVPQATKLNPNVSDEQWVSVKKDLEAQVHSGLGIVNTARKKYDAAIAEYKTALELQPQKDPTVMVRLAAVLADAGKYDEAMTLADQVNGMPDVAPQIKQVASQTKLKAATAKSKK